MENIVIVGAGHAGVELAHALRKEGFGGRVTLVSDEPDLPYQRPPLSKDFLKRDGARPLLLKAEALYGQNRIELRLKSKVVAIDRERKCVRFESGEELVYDHLALATGARNRRLDIPGLDHPAILELRGLEHSRIFLGRLPTLGRVTIIGGGFIGLEIAGLLREKGVAVDLVEMADRLMARAVSRPVSDFFLELHRRMGTEVHLHSMLASAYHGPEGVEVRLSDGRRLHSDAVLLAAGVLPNVELAAAAGLDVDNGILVDDYLRTSDPAISALGDCAQFPCVFCDGQARLESVQNAVDQARSIAKRLCGRPTPYTDLPWFWSNQGAARLQIAGLSTGHDRTVLRGDPERGKFSVFLYRGEKLIAVESVNAAAEHLAARKLLAKGLSVPCELAAQHDVDFRHLAT